MRPRLGCKRAELLVALALGVMSFGLLCGCAQKAGIQGNATNTQHNIKNIVTACRTAEVEHIRLPPIFAPYGRPPQPGQPLRTANVFVHLLPYLENNQLFRDGGFERATVKVLLSELDESIAENQVRYTSFAANLRVFSSVGAAMPWDNVIGSIAACREGSLSTDKILDGAGNTVLFTTKFGVCNGTPNFFDYAPEANRKAGPYFGAGNHRHGGVPTPNIPTGRQHNIPPYQINPIPLGHGTNVCNDDAGLYGHSFGTSGLIVGMGDTSTRRLSFSITGDTWAKAITPGDGQPLGNDW